jgi:hypothetical protein
MATTTNYSWSTPDDTALVKDGAAAIRTLGSSADTTVKALNPGTTAGDIDYYTTSTAKARVAIGTAGQVLQVNSGATAPEWATPSSGGMTLISTTTLTGASVTISSIPSGYNSLELRILNYLPATDNVYCKLRINNDTNTRYNQFFGDSINNEIFASYNYLQISMANDNSVNYGLSIIKFPDYASTNVNATTTTNFNHLGYSGKFAYNQLAAITSLVLFPDSGNFTSGTALLYGVK